VSLSTGSESLLGPGRLKIAHDSVSAEKSGLIADITLTRSPKIDLRAQVLIVYSKDARTFQALVSLISRKNRMSGKIDDTEGI
jgi:hypothetical protein